MNTNLPNTAKSERRRPLFFLITLAGVIILIELLSLLFIKAFRPDLPRYDIIPTYLSWHKDDIFDTLPDPISPRYIDTLYPWCTWHPRSVSNRLVRACFDVTTPFNELGTRGILPDKQDERTILVVGDSFAEGFGLEDKETCAQLLSASLQTPVLNLGCGGVIGTTQMSLIYEWFAPLFEHRQVYVFFYFGNDLNENNIALHDVEYSDRFRPYRVFRADNSSEIVYRGSLQTTNYNWDRFNSIKANGFLRLRKLSLKGYFQRYEKNLLSKLSMLTYSRRIASLLWDTVKDPQALKISRTPNELQYTPDDLRIVAEDIRVMIETAKAHKANITFINLPSRALLEAMEKDPDLIRQYQKLERELSALCKDEKAGYRSFYTYLSTVDPPIDELFFSCDNHYSAFANHLLAEFILGNHSLPQ